MVHIVILTSDSDACDFPTIDKGDKLVFLTSENAMMPVSVVSSLSQVDYEIKTIADISDLGILGYYIGFYSAIYQSCSIHGNKTVQELIKKTHTQDKPKKNRNKRISNKPDSIDEGRVKAIDDSVSHNVSANLEIMPKPTSASEAVVSESSTDNSALTATKSRRRKKKTNELASINAMESKYRDLFELNGLDVNLGSLAYIAEGKAADSGKSFDAAFKSVLKDNKVDKTNTELALAAIKSIRPLVVC